MVPLPPICLTANYLQISLNALSPKKFKSKEFFFLSLLCVEKQEWIRENVNQKNWYCYSHMYMSDQRVNILRAINDLLGIIHMGHMWLKFNRQSSMMRNKTKQNYNYVKKDTFSYETVWDWKSAENLFFTFSRKDIFWEVL